MSFEEWIIRGVTFSIVALAEVLDFHSNLTWASDDGKKWRFKSFCWVMFSPELHFTEILAIFEKRAQKCFFFHQKMAKILGNTPNFEQLLL